MIILLQRYKYIIDNKFFMHKDYEFYVKYVMDKFNIERGFSNTYYFKIRNNRSIFWNNMWYNYNFINKISENKLIKYNDIQMMYNKLKDELKNSK